MIEPSVLLLLLVVYVVCCLGFVVLIFELIDIATNAVLRRLE